MTVSSGVEGRYPLLTLIALNGQEKGRKYTLTGEQPVLLGRQSDAIRLTDAQTSRKHAEIILQNNTWLIRDLGSTNGTWVNGQKIKQITELEQGDRIVLGRHQFRVAEITDLPAPTPQPKPVTPEPAIGSEDLAEMGVDLSESLSADLLEDEELDESAILDEHSDSEPQQPPAEASEHVADKKTPEASEAAEPSSSKAASESAEDELIDLDALLGESEPEKSEPEPSSAEPQASLPLETQPETESSQVESSPTETEPEQEIKDQPEEVIDLDQVLEESSAESEQSEAASADDIDIDALLGFGEEETKSKQEEPVSTESEQTDEQASQAVADQPEPTQVQASSSDAGEDVLDLDALLADSADQPQADEAPSIEDETEPDQTSTDSEPQAEQIEEAPPEVEDQPPAPAGESESLVDIDILAEAKPESESEKPSEPETAEATDQHDAAEPADVDVAEPDIEALLTDDTTNETAPAEPGLTEEPASADISSDDSLSPEDVAEHIEDASEDVLSTEPQPAPSPTDIDETEPDTALPGEGEQESEEDQADPLAVSTGELSETEKDLLLSAEEQEQVVTNYRRSRIKKITAVVFVLGLLAVAIWYGLNVQADRPTGDTEPEQTVQPALTPTPEQPQPIAADSRSIPPSSGHNPTNPDTIEPTQPDHNRVTHSKPTPVEPAAPEMADTIDTDPISVPKPTPEQAAPPPPPVVFPDPFEDVAPGLSAPTEPVNELTTPAESDAPQPDTPKPDTPTPSVDSAPEKPVATDTAPILEPSTNEASTSRNDTPVEDATPADVNAEAPATATGSSASQGQETHELAMLTELVESQHSAKDRVAEQAAYAGARKVAFLVDASGSLVDSFPIVLRELSQEITRLPDDRAFTVIFFGAEGVLEVPPVGMRWADRANKQRVRDWIDPSAGHINAWGRGDLFEAVRHALTYQPNEIVLLSDNLTSRLASEDTIKQTVDQLAELIDGKVEQIHVVQFFNRDPHQLLKSIAERFDGTYNLILDPATRNSQSSAVDSVMN